MTNASSAITTRNGGASIEREGFGSREVEQRHETSTSAVVAQVQAEIQARYVMAMRNPRDDDNVRVRLLKECSRPNFAKRAFYSLPRGNKPGRMTGTPNRIEGLTVRFAEAAIRLMGNVLQATRTVYDDDVKRMVNVAATDLETNAVYSRDVIIEKTVERASPKSGAVILGKRTNSAGNDVYIVQSTEEELLQKESMLCSKMFRTEALRLLPADTIEECEQRIVATVTNEDAKDPDAARKQVADAFASINVLPADLKAYIGHDISQCSPAELRDLRGLYAAIRDGEVTWAEVIAEKAKNAEAGPEEKKSAGASVAERVKARTQQQTTPAPANAPQGASPSTTAPVPRDFPAEATALKQAITDAGDDTKKLAAVRRKFEAFTKEAPAEVAEDVHRFFVMVTGEAKKKATEPATHDGREPPADWTPGAERQPGED